MELLKLEDEANEKNKRAGCASNKKKLRRLLEALNGTWKLLKVSKKERGRCVWRNRRKGTVKNT